MSYQLYKDLTPAVESALRASIERFGVLVPVTMDQHGNVLDGHQRLRIAGELGVDVPTTTHIVASEDEAREIARTLNEDRRAMPRAERLEVVKALREEGHSVRAIAGAVGSPPSTIQRDLSVVRNGTTEPERITGLSGKSYPATRAPQPAAQPERRRVPGVRGAQRVDPTKAIGRIFDQMRGMTIALGSCDYSGYEADAQELSDLTNCIRALVRLRKNLEEPQP